MKRLSLIVLFLTSSSSFLWEHVDAQTQKTMIQENIIPFFFNLVSKTIFATTPMGPTEALVRTNTSDPLTIDMAEEVTVGVFDLNSCESTTVMVTFTVIDMEGLSTLQMEDINMTMYQWTGSSFKASGILDFLEVSFLGVVEGDGCTSSMSHFFSGTSTLINPTLSFTASTTSTGLLSITITSIDITDLTLNWDSIDVNMTQIDAFSNVSSEVESAVAVGVANATQTIVNEAFLEDAIEDILPLDLGGASFTMLEVLLLAFMSSLTVLFSLIGVIPLLGPF